MGISKTSKIMWSISAGLQFKRFEVFSHMREIIETLSTFARRSQNKKKESDFSLYEINPDLFFVFVHFEFLSNLHYQAFGHTVNLIYINLIQFSLQIAFIYFGL